MRRVAVDHVAAGQQVAGHPVAAVGLAELRGGRVQRDRDPVGAGLVPGVGDGLHQQGQHLFWLGDLGREAALVTQAGRQLAGGQLAAQRAVDLRAGADGLGHRRGAHRGDHELLEVQLVGRVNAAVEHVEMRHRQRRGDPFGGQPPPQRHPGRGGQRPGQRHRGSHRGVGAQPALVRGPVQVDHRLVHLGQRGPRPPAQQVGQLAVDRRDRPQHALALIPGRVAVPSLHRLPRPRRRPGRHPRPRRRPVRQPHRHRQRRPPRESRISSADKSATSNAAIVCSYPGRRMADPGVFSLCLIWIVSRPGAATAGA